MTGPWEIGKLLSVTEEFFKTRGIDSARLDAEVLLAHTLEVSRESLIAGRERKLTDFELSAYRERVRQRARMKPVAYLVNKKEFFSLPIYVNEHVLIPRPETEHLVEQAIRFLQSRDSGRGEAPPRVCDIGTGSGCVAAAIAHSCPKSIVTATEISPDAAKIAVKNISDLGLLSRVLVVQCNLFPIDPSGPFDLIISNPPYLSLQEFDSLPPTVREFEPRIALTDDEDGLDFYRRILKTAAKCLTPDGSIFLEVSPRIAEEFPKNRLLENSAFSLKAIHPDLSGRPRIAEFLLKPL